MKPALYPCILALVLVFTAKVAVAASPVPAASASAPVPQASATLLSVAPAASSTSANPDKTLDLDFPPPLSLKKGMSYGKARDRLIAQGWRPAHFPYCTWGVLNFFGSDVQRNYKKICKSDDQFYKDACHVCSYFPELSDCTGDGYCDVFFGRGVDKLNIMIMLGDFDNDGMRDSHVTNWGQVTTRPWPYK
jgi:hypothetical protein